MRRMVCVDMGSILILRPFLLHRPFSLTQIVGKMDIEPISTHTIRREILR